MCVCGRNASVARCSSCPPGETGPEGRSIAFAVAEADISVCPYGGSTITIGYDDNKDGIPETLLQTINLCNAAPGGSGTTPTFIMGTVTTLAPGALVTVSLTPTANPNEYAINIGIPVGATGDTPTFTIGTVTDLPYGDSPTVTFSGTPPAYVLNFGIPAGPAGTTASDDLVVSGVAIPACFSGIVADGDSGTQFIQAMMNKICQVNSLITSEMDNNNFRASKTVIQPLVGLSAIKLYFEDDFTSPNYDPGNHFFTDEYVATEAVVKNFGIERVKLTTVGFNHTFVIAIKKNGTTIVDTGVLTQNSVDVYNKSLAVDSEFTIPTLIAPLLSLAAGDKVTVEFTASINNSGLQAEAQGTFSNS